MSHEEADIEVCITTGNLDVCNAGFAKILVEHLADACILAHILCILTRMGNPI
jgi:hypothetical protein